MARTEEETRLTFRPRIIFSDRGEIFFQKLRSITVLIQFSGIEIISEFIYISPRVRKIKGLRALGK